MTLIEAKDVLGGRISTDYLGEDKIPVDRGAQWLQGIGPGLLKKKEASPSSYPWTQEYNPLYEVCKAHGIETIE